MESHDRQTPSPNATCELTYLYDGASSGRIQAVQVTDPSLSVPIALKICRGDYRS